MLLQKILVVDDDCFIRRLVEVTLALVGKWDVTLAASGEQALEMAAQDPPDLILLDIRMPAMDGPATLEALKANSLTAEIPVIFITASIQTHELERLRRLDVAGVITKPFDPMKLPVEIHCLIENWLASKVTQPAAVLVPAGGMDFYDLVGFGEVSLKRARANNGSRAVSVA